MGERSKSEIARRYGGEAFTVASETGMGPRELADLCKELTEAKEALQELLGAYDPEQNAILCEPDPGCLQCTAGTTPNNRNTGLCPRHQLERLAQ